MFRRLSDQPTTFTVRGRVIKNVNGAIGTLWAATCEGPIFVYDHNDTGTVVGVCSAKKDVFLWWQCSVSAYRALSRDEKREIHMSVLKKAATSVTDKPCVTPKDPAFIKRWPGLWEHLTCAEYPDDGGPRKTSTVSIFLGDQGLTGALNDRDNQRACFACGASLEKLLDALEAACTADDTPWRNDKQATGNSARKKPGK